MIKVGSFVKEVNSSIRGFVIKEKVVTSKILGISETLFLVDDKVNGREWVNARYLVEVKDAI